MFQFTTTTIINSNLDSNGSTAKYSGTSTAFTVTRVNKFLTSKILSVSKRPYSAGIKEIATITIPTHTLGAVIRLNVDLRLSQNVYSEFANAYLYFKKPIQVEVIATGTAATDAAALIVQINALKDRFGSSYFTVASGGGAVINFTAKDFTQRFYSITSDEQTAVSNSLIQYDYVTKATGSVTTPGALGFGDDAWMISSVQIPTLENTRYWGINKDERPILGGNYTQYTIRYSVAKDTEDGIIGSTNSITTHVFYVLSTLQAAFETALNIAYQNIITIGGDQDLIIVGDQIIAASAGATQYTAINANAGETINWTNTVLTGTTSANTTGVLTVGATTGSTTLTATGATSGKTATMVITVV